jgi:hypothetical protein
MENFLSLSSPVFSPVVPQETKNIENTLGTNWVIPRQLNALRVRDQSMITLNAGTVVYVTGVNRMDTDPNIWFISVIYQNERYNITYRN